MLTRRQVISGTLAGTAAASGWSGAAAPFASATTARAVTLPQLVGLTQHALVGTPIDAWSRWETLGASRRIVTYVQVEVLQSIDGRPPAERTVSVRTLGGSVGDIGQLVHGEARLAMDKPSVVFLHSDSQGVLSVAAMAQGHFPLITEGSNPARLSASRDLPHLLKGRATAASELADKTVVEAEDLVCRCLLDARR